MFFKYKKILLSIGLISPIFFLSSCSSSFDKNKTESFNNQLQKIVLAKENYNNALKEFKSEYEKSYQDFIWVLNIIRTSFKKLDNNKKELLDKIDKKTYDILFIGNQSLFHYMQKAVFLAEDVAEQFELHKNQFLLRPNSYLNYYSTIIQDLNKNSTSEQISLFGRQIRENNKIWLNDFRQSIYDYTLPKLTEKDYENLNKIINPDLEGKVRFHSHAMLNILFELLMALNNNNDFQEKFKLFLKLQGISDYKTLENLSKNTYILDIYNNLSKISNYLRRVQKELYNSFE
ncbi:hypothetical protein [Mycoplasmopsis alligatoris]|uniref:hypothetical protein n=1 Tax=Mycoplasmopsis alligatoris TaxID=47687 RepID=UPI0002ED63D4|nr:hypothetical protein [Mycoplasmopsis alligatoris]